VGIVSHTVINASLPEGVAGLWENSRGDTLLCLFFLQGRGIGYASLTSAAASPLAVWRSCG
jgi:hypothetical protein